MGFFSGALGNTDWGDNPIWGQAGGNLINKLVGQVKDQVGYPDNTSNVEPAQQQVYQPSYQTTGNWTPQELLPEHLRNTRVGLNQPMPSYTQTPVQNPLDQGRYVGNPNHGGGGSFMPMPLMVDEGQRMNTYPRFEESPGQPMPYPDWQGSMPGRPNYQGGGYSNKPTQFSPENRWGLNSFEGREPTQEDLQGQVDNFTGMFSQNARNWF